MTNPSKLEQVARALQEQAPKGSFLTSADYWLVMARAAIAAMEVPTEEMVEYGWRWRFDDEEHKWNVQKNKPKGYAPDHQDIVIEPLFVRAALKEEK